jgi:hypothetical protein
MLTIIHLKRGETLLGVLHVVGSEFPWTRCTFDATPDFEQVRPLFEDELAVLETKDMEAWAASYNKIVALKLQLVDAATGSEVGDGDFLLHIRGDEAWLRY